MEIYPSEIKMNTCERCRHWNEWEENTCGSCFIPATTSDWPEGDQIMCSDTSEDGTPYLITAPNFGCVHWEPKGLQV